MRREKRERSAHDYALDLLSQRAYTRTALERKLTAKGFPADTVATEMQALERARLIDDEKFADAYARTQLTSRKKSARRVTLELIKKGVAADIARAAIEAILSEGSIDIEQSLRKIAEKKSATLHGLGPGVRRRRLFAYLRRQGFEGDAIRRYLSDVS